MKPGHYFTAGLVLATVALAFSGRVSAQRAGGTTPRAGADMNAAAAAKPTPRTPDGHPDLSGVWGGGGGDDTPVAAAGQSVRILFPVRTDPNDKRIFDEMDRAAKERQAAEPNKPPYKPELAAKVQELSDKRQFNDPSFFCKPLGVPRVGVPSQIVQTPNQVLMLYMWEKRWRVIWTDGRQLPTNPDPRWYGYSVGRWVDDYTFVVNSNGTDDRTWLDNTGNPHSDQLKVEERYHRVSKDTMELTVVIDDPKAYTKTWLGRDRLQMKLLPADTDFMEMIPSASESAAVRSVYALESAPKK